MNQRMNARTADCQQDHRSEVLMEQIVKAMAAHYKMELSAKIALGKKESAMGIRSMLNSTIRSTPARHPWYRISSGVLPPVSP